LASNLAHVPAINGLYSFVFNPVSLALLALELRHWQLFRFSALICGPDHLRDFRIMPPVSIFLQG